MLKSLKKYLHKKDKYLKRRFKKYLKSLKKYSKKRYLKKRAQELKRRPGLLIGTLLIMLGLIFGGLSLFNAWLSQHSAAKPTSQALKSNSQTNDVPLITGTPVRIQIPSVSIDLKVIPGYYYKVSNSWTLTLNDAQWGVMTAKPNNQGGDTFIYAHYRLGVFYTLPKVQPGAKVLVTTSNNHRFTYKFRNSTITTPQDTSVFSYKGKPILVLQTCTGLWFQNRQLFVFDLVRAV